MIIPTPSISKNAVRKILVKKDPLCFKLTYLGITILMFFSQMPIKKRVATLATLYIY